MKTKIMLIVKELKLASLDDIFSFLENENIKKSRLKELVNSLCNERCLIRILHDENSLSKELFVPGPNLKVEDEQEIKKLIISSGVSSRDLSVVDWGKVSKRIFDSFVERINHLKNDIVKKYEEPKKLEMRYFDLSLQYHEFYRFFYELHETDFIEPIYKFLQECKVYLDELDYT